MDMSHLEQTLFFLNDIVSMSVLLTLGNCFLSFGKGRICGKEGIALISVTTCFCFCFSGSNFNMKVDPVGNHHGRTSGSVWNSKAKATRKSL